MATAMKTIIAVAGLGGLLGSAALFASKPSDVGETAARDTRPSWTEIGWPFPIDQWGSGKAFNCKPSDCGAEINLYVRAKIGFCNCATGVADDEELERVGDLPLVGSPPYSAAGPGRPLAAARMQGRSSSIPDHRFIRLAQIRSRGGAQRPLRRDRGDRDRQRPSADIGGGCGHPILEWRCDSAMGRHGARPVAGDPRAAFRLTTCLRGEEGASAHSVFHGTALRSISWNTTEVISPRMPMVTIPTNMMSTCSSSQEFQIR